MWSFVTTRARHQRCIGSFLPVNAAVHRRVEGMEMPSMPKRDKFAALTKEEVELVWVWIEQGAVWPEGVVLSAPQTENHDKARRKPFYEEWD